MEITVKLKLDYPHDLTAEEIEKDLRMGEDQIGWNYEYIITDVKVTGEPEERFAFKEAHGDSCLPEREGTREANAEIKMQCGSEMPTGRRTEGIM